MAGADHITIVGTGFAGLALAIFLKEAGFDDFTLLERADRVGGTWRDNHYPGAACDVESHLYSFSFEPKHDWSRQFAPQWEILQYLEHCADKYGIRPHIRFGVEVTGASFDERSGLWTLRTRKGEVLQSRVVVSCCGGLSRPSVPEIDGLSSFEGKAFHSARWDHDCPLDGKTVAVIGTGASAIQIVPSIAPKVGKLHLFQRTPPWILPKPDHDISARTQKIFQALPMAQRLARRAIYLQREILGLGFTVEPRILKLAERLALRYLRKSVHDPSLRAKMTPDYRLGCKRILPTNEFYPAIQRANVEVVTDGIERVTATGVRTRDGRERKVDAIVLCTGFMAAEQVAPFEVRGRRGQDLNETWRDGAEAYLGTSVAGFPNFFIIVGPNTGLGHSSMVLMIESQARYIASALKTMRGRDLKLVDVRRDVQDEYNRRLHARLANTVWASGCKSWYQTRSGKNTTLWPGFTFEFRYKTRRFDPDSYELVGKADDRAPETRDDLRVAE